MLSSFFHPATQFRLRVAAAPTFVGETKTRSGTLLAGVPPVELFANPIRDPTSEHDIFASSFLAYSMFALLLIRFFCISCHSQLDPSDVLHLKQTELNAFLEGLYATPTNRINTSSIPRATHRYATVKEAGGRIRDSKRVDGWLGRREDDTVFVSPTNAGAAAAL
ncbi:uncharacterized protein HKW66_Vig0076960 [Vigna angularis]|uniref:Uncharacterized protein n=1 Tax=Phaseolus angularis TaxID=3914 RepID=A0A8T0K6Q1_PHAAN|nr:uncharacterized protein HKW66_Vig0076960 [Vigna angularis]